ncbi:hypothetical protein OAA60_03490 [Porticoccaceae bacterium]|nr:hypothetical protein [Porticoccaceae bacterium]
MNSINLAVFSEDAELQEKGTPIYPLQGEDLYFCVPRVGGFKYQKQIQSIIKSTYGIYHEQSDIDMNEVSSIWLGEYVTEYGNVLDSKTGEALEFTRSNCRAIFNNKSYHQSLVPILMNKAANFEIYLTEEGREAIEELKKL